MEKVRVLWFQVAIGVWMILSPWFLGFSNIFLAKWSNVIVGLILGAISVWEIFEKGQRSEKVIK